MTDKEELKNKIWALIDNAWEVVGELTEPFKVKYEGEEIISEPIVTWNPSTFTVKTVDLEPETLEYLKEKFKKSVYGEKIPFKTEPVELKTERNKGQRLTDWLDDACFEVEQFANRYSGDDGLDVQSDIRFVVTNETLHVWRHYE